ncbi:MAG: dicarboxylate/amino acid:cation symporter [Planctomycetota bacterium]|nr:dicarboxylate/amino acid:cation symporter [Planctomycetota bacterium]
MSETRPGVPLHRKVLIGLVLGVLVGAAANLWAGTDAGRRSVVAFAADGIAHPVGQIFLRLLFLVVVPLVFASLSVGVANLGDLRKLGRMGGRTLGFFFLTTSFAAVLGITQMHLVQPGAGFDDATRQSLMDQFSANAAEYQSKVEFKEGLTTIERVNKVLDWFLPRNVLGAITRMDMLPLIVLALLFGAALTQIPDSRRHQMCAWLETVAEAMVGIVGFAMKLAPYAVFCLVYAVVAKFGLDLLQKLALYVVVVLAGYLIVLFVFYPILIATLARRSPVDYLRRSIPIMVTAFSTSSSNATLPTSLRVAQQDLGIRPQIAGFVLPLGATMNMNGTALFEGCVVLFVAQVFGIDLSISQQVLVVLLCVFSAIGAAGVPGGSLPLLMTVMAQVGVPPDGIAIVLGVDRLLDMGRTVVNVMGDVVCCGYVERAESARRGA